MATSVVGQLKKIAESQLVQPGCIKLEAGKETDREFQEQLSSSISYLASAKTQEELEQDPYWPKWDGPWWHMLLLFEIGLADRIPKQAVDKLVSAMNSHYLEFFPFYESEIPDGKDAVRNIACHCQLALVKQVLFAAGVDLDSRLPWLRPWFLKYQLADGGLNCDESAYSKKDGKSSIVSTLPALEAVLHASPDSHSEMEIQFLEAGAAYLIDRKLKRRKSNPELLISAEFEKLCFPRFYHYDELRGLNLLLDWALLCKKTLPADAIQETVISIHSRFGDGLLHPERKPLEGASSLWRCQNSDGWYRAPAKSFPLLDKLSAQKAFSPYLSSKWHDACEKLHLLSVSGLLKEG